MASGKFVLRLPTKLHAEFQKEAREKNTSLNNLILEKLGHLPLKQKQFHIVEKVFRGKLLGIIQFGSTVRGEARKDSDIDLLLVLSSSVPIDRSLYALWDAQVAPHLKAPYSPQFVHLPSDWNMVSGLWLEVGLEGEVKLDHRQEVRTALNRIKSLIAEGKYERRVSHGHSYWVRN